VGHLTSIVLGAVVLQTYITASFVLEACAGLKLSILYGDGWKFHVPSATAVQHEDSSESTRLSLLTKHYLGKIKPIFTFTTLGSLRNTWALCGIRKRLCR
jgi:hypothetical protein